MLNPGSLTHSVIMTCTDMWYSYNDVEPFTHSLSTDMWYIFRKFKLYPFCIIFLLWQHTVIAS